jgi:GntR family transcriptional regulator
MLWSIDPASRLPLQEQIAGCVRRAVADGELAVGDQLPPAAELAEALDVDRNTVLAAYRRLRDAGVLEFRRGRGARVASAARPQATVEQAARDLVELARNHGYPRADLIKIVEELS